MQDRNFLQCSEMQHVLSRNARPPSTPYVLFIGIFLFVVNEGKHNLEMRYSATHSSLIAINYFTR